MDVLLYLGVGLVGLALLVLAVALGMRRRRRLPYYARRALLSRGELAFFTALRDAVPRDLLICPKVRLADVIECPQDRWKEFGGKIACKHVDFVLMDERTAEIRLLIELDDRTHQRPDRQERDRFLDQAVCAAGLPVLHVAAAPRYDARELQGLLRRAFDQKTSARERHGLL